MPLLPATSVDFFLAALESFMRRTGQGTHWGVTRLQLKGRPDEQSLSRTWAQIHSQHPMLQARLMRQWRGWRWAWEVRGPASPAPGILWHPAQPQPPDMQLIQQRLQGRTETGELSTPLFMEVFPSGDHDDHTILLTWRHALLDGTGVSLLLEKLAAGPGGMPPPSPPPAPGRESIATLYKKARPLINRLHAMTSAGCLSAWTAGMRQNGIPCYRLIALSPEESEKAAARLRTLCGDLMQMPFYAAVAARALSLLHSLRRWRSPEIHLQLPIQLRGRNRELIFGNHMGTLPLFLESSSLTTLDQSVAHLLQCYREAIKTKVPQSSEALMTLAAHMPPGAFIPAVRISNRGQICSLFHSHTGTFLPGREDFAGASLHDVYTIPSVCAPPGFGVFVSDYAGRITVTMAWRDGCLAPQEVDALDQSIRSDLCGTR